MVAAPVEGRSRRTPALLAGTTIAMLAAVHLASGYGTSGMPDAMRDLYWAEEILRGVALPVRGPVIHGTIELGPWWYYVVALALWLSGSLAGASALVALLAAAKYALAWRLGSKLLDAWLGLAFVAALVVPGWSAAPLGFPTHTALVETALLALALATVACRERLTLLRAVGFGAAAAFCAHAHPSTVLLVAIAGLAVLQRQRNPFALSAMGIAAAIAVASLLPPLLARTDAATEFGSAMAEYAARDIGVDPVSRALRLVASVAVGGGWHGMLLLTGFERGHWVAVVVAGVAMLAAGTGLSFSQRRGSPELRLACAGLALFAAQAVFLALIRPITPVWMTSTLVPPFAFALACGWRALARGGAAARAFAFVAAAAWLAVGLAIFAFFVREVDTMRIGRGGNVFMDAGMPWTTGYDEARIARVRLRRLERAVRHACGDVTLHGDLASADEAALGLPSRRACGAGAGVEYGGRAPDRAHVAGYVLESWCAIGLKPATAGDGFGYSSGALPIAPDEGALRPRLGPRQVDAIPAPLAAGPLAVRAELPAGAVVALGKRYGWLHDLVLHEVRAGGRPAVLVHEDLATRFYRCDGCGGHAVPWEIAGSGNAAGIDFVALSDDPGGVDACALVRDQ